MKAGIDVIRRTFFFEQFIAAFAIPVWLFVGWGVYGGSGWGFLGILITAPVVFIALLVIALIVFARPAVRRERMVSWKDVALFTVLHGSLIALGFFGQNTTLFVALALLAGIAGFWLSLWELFTDSARSMRATMAAFEQAAAPPQQAQQQGQQPAPSPQQQGQQPPRVPPRKPGDDPEVIVIHEVRD